MLFRKSRGCKQEKGEHSRNIHCSHHVARKQRRSGNMKIKRAFTLIELLVVIAIIAILAAILFPVLAEARRAARDTAALSNTKQMALALVAYESDYDDKTILERYDGRGNWAPWPHFLLPYVKNKDIYYDPSQERLIFDLRSLGFVTAELNWAFQTPMGINIRGYASDGDGGAPRITSTIPDVAARAAFFYSGPNLSNAGAWTIANSFYFDSYYAPCPLPSDLNHVQRYEVYRANAPYRGALLHRQMLPVAFADGHAKSVPIAKVTRSNDNMSQFNSCIQWNPQNNPRGIPYDFWGYEGQP